MEWAELLTYTPGKDLREGHVFLIDKPLGWTSYNVVGKVKYALQHRLGLRNIKVGHAGTLDPLATGLMVVCVGRATKLAQQYTGEDKTYQATFALGATTPSYDLETEIDQHYPTEHVSEELISRTAQSFLGVYEQIPPPFSAKRINGRRAYDMVRAGKDVTLKAVPVRIDRFEIVRIDMPYVIADIQCSKGTYIRSMARDFGERMESGAHLAGLRRTASGPFSIEGALTVTEFEDWIGLVAKQSACGDASGLRQTLPTPDA